MFFVDVKLHGLAETEMFIDICIPGFDTLLFFFTNYFSCYFFTSLPTKFRGLNESPKKNKKNHEN